jgi:hypothetical protein
LAYEPNNEKSAVAEYQKWCTKLAEHDWPFCFGVPKGQPKVEEDRSQKEIEDTESHYHTPVSHPEYMSDLVDHVNHEEEVDQKTKLESIDEADVKDEHVEYMDAISDVDVPEAANSDSFMDAMNDFPVEEKMDHEIIYTKENQQLEQDVDDMTHTLNSCVFIEQLSSRSPTATASSSPPPPAPASENQSQAATTTSSSPAPSTPSTPTGTTKKGKEPIPPEPFVSLDQLDLANVPQSWHDVVYVAPSLIPHGGNGLFAKRNLPYNTPIGFYFGVPMTEDEFDSCKDRVGRSSEYSIMYRRTVLDATDESGQPILDETNPRFCPFHFMNETNSQKTASVAFVEGAIVNQIICWTKKEIHQDEELLVWYGKDVHRYWTEEEEEANKQKEEQEKMKNRKIKQKRESVNERAKLMEEKKQQKEMEELKRLQEEESKRYRRQEVRNKSKKKTVTVAAETKVAVKKEVVPKVVKEKKAEKKLKKEEVAVEQEEAKELTLEELQAQEREIVTIEDQYGEVMINLESAVEEEHESSVGQFQALPAALNQNSFRFIDYDPDAPYTTKREKIPGAVVEKKPKKEKSATGTPKKKYVKKDKKSAVNNEDQSALVTEELKNKVQSEIVIFQEYQSVNGTTKEKQPEATASAVIEKEDQLETSATIVMKKDTEPVGTIKEDAEVAACTIMMKQMRQQQRWKYMNQHYD